jgi:Fe-S protein assembly co-chaperone HscB
MQTLHPDRHRNKSHEEQDELHNRASSVTQAYRVLNAPHHRALHLLELMGKPMEEHTQAALLGPNFLMELMEIREAIDCCADDTEIRRLMKENVDRMDKVGIQLGEALDGKHHDLDRALVLTAELQYWNRVQETLREKKM